MLTFIEKYAIIKTLRTHVYRIPQTKTYKLEIKSHVQHEINENVIQINKQHTRSNMKIIIMNGAPSSGKDQCSLFLRKLFPSSLHFSFKRKLISLTCMIYDVDRAIWDSWYTTEGKEIPRKELNGLSCRQALIFVSEEVIKPKFGESYFGVQECKLLSSVLEKDYTFAISSDGGFEQELKPIADKFGCNNVNIIQLHRPGKTFEGDSRSFINPVFIPSENIHILYNDKDLLELEYKLLEIANRIRNT